MKEKILKLASILITLISITAILAAGSSIVIRNRIIALLLEIWWLIPVAFLFINFALYCLYAESLALLQKGILKVTGGRSGNPLFINYVFMIITAIAESWVIVLLRYMIVQLLTVDNLYIDLAVGGCVASCIFVLLAFISLLLGSVVYGCSWKAVCSNTEAQPAYLVTIGLTIEIVNIIVWCFCF